jgi:hypothetical protein
MVPACLERGTAGQKACMVQGPQQDLTQLLVAVNQKFSFVNLANKNR